MAEGQDTGSPALADNVGGTDELEKLIGWFDTALEALSEQRHEAQLDRDYYDGDQWSEGEKEDLKARGQPETVTNHIAPKVNFIIGTMEDARVDPVALPITKAHDDGAEAMSDAMRHVVDSQDADVEQADATEEFMIEGVAAMLVDPVVENGGKGIPKIELTHIPYDRFAWDHRSRKRDFSDARWLAAVAWYDLEDAQDIYPDKEDMLTSAIQGGIGSETDDIHDDHPSHWAERNEQRVRICHMVYKKRGVWMEAHFTKHDDGFLVEPREVKLKDENGKTKCTIIAASPYIKRRRAGRPAERYGIVRNLRSPQDEINKRRSKALHYALMARVMAEAGAFLMTKEEVLEEIPKPDGYLEVAPGALAAGKIDIQTNLELTNTQFQLLQEAKDEIDNIGPQAPLVGSDDRVQTGRSLQVRQEAGEKQLRPMVKSLRFWQRRLYRAIAWAVRMYWKSEHWLRVTDDATRKGYRFIAINRPIVRFRRMQELMQERVPFAQAIQMVGLEPVVADELLSDATQAAQQMLQEAAADIKAQTGKDVPPEQLQPMLQQAVQQTVMSSPVMQQKYTENKTDAVGIDIRIDVQPDHAITQHEQFEKLTELAGTGQVQIPTRVLIESSQLRDKKKLIEQLEPPPDPVAEQMKQLNLALLQARVEKTRAEAKDEEASAQQRMSDSKFKLESQAMKTQAQAMEAAANAGKTAGG